MIFTNIIIIVVFDGGGESSSSSNDSIENVLQHNSSIRIIDNLFDEILEEVARLENEEEHAHNYTKITLFVSLLMFIIFIKLKCPRVSEWFNKSKRRNRRNSRDNITIQELNYTVNHEHESA
nr:hypothetical protein [Spodoptera litura nucleopolyhedrovirus]WML75191.1 hypothetical protein KBIHDJOI_00018 [Spodoptera littoralis nucleopolyhedrovirus]WOC30984.1 hypothetical protein GACBDANE_00009 [Spodoptera litura nucleopolyhedrovirus]